MADYDPKHVKNIALVGHAGSGKTTLAETMLFESGAINRRGSVEEGNTVSDYHEVEHERENSIFSTVMHTDWRNYKINIIDTPGFDDFIGEVISSLRVADTAVMLLNAQHGVEVGTESLWEYIDRYKKPLVFVANQLDHPKADFDKTLEQAKNRFGRKLTLVQYPLNTGPDFDTIVDVLRMKVYKFSAEGGKPEKLSIPDSEKEKAAQLHNDLIESIAENDEGLMELYFEKGTLSEDEMRKGLKMAMMQHELFPFFCVSAKKNMGSGRLMGFIDNVAPSAVEMPGQPLKKGDTLACDPKGKTNLFVFKTVSEQHLGDMSFFKVCSGEVKSGMELENAQSGNSEKISQLYIVEGRKRTNVDMLTAGDIGATVKLKSTHTNNTLQVKGQRMELDTVEYPEPTIRKAIVCKSKGDEEKLAIALHQIHEEDPTLIVEHSKELRQTLLHGQGEMHLAIAKWELEHRFGLEIDFDKPRISYRETIQKSVQSSYKHKKQSGGSGQFGEVHMQVEPFYEGMPDPDGFSVRGTEVRDLPWGGKLVFLNCIVGGVIDNRFLPAILKGIMEKMQEGPLTGSPVMDVRVSVFDGKMHPVDSNDISFKIAGIMAFRDAFRQADPKILEPVYQVKVLTPGDLTGDIMSDLQTRRAIIEGIDTQEHYQSIIARVPLSEMDDFSSALRSISQGRAKFTMKFEEYVAVPYDVQQRLLESYKSETEAV